ncbi:restriction endonuclease subunit S [Butyribacter intestini]|jgi:type I restriction enzyme, S subunit|uniref:Restriction endonuclease subunit S n=3 Tax=Butyribacter intestini TaxID=1703332 RepID=A0AAW3JU35_9FIRM|nr:restriction endonuclease subunit S [Butyribacter intestini]
MHLIYEHMMFNMLNNMICGKHIFAKDICNVVTGKEDANFATENGKYKFFTCASTPSLCDEYVFESKSILIAGNGEFNVKHYDGKFNAYQRTYVLSPEPELYGLLYLSSLYRINSFKSGSAGSIVKFITKGDVENIPVFIPNDTELIKSINSLVHFQDQVSIENEQLCTLRDWLLPMLMNGQATIED